MPKTSFIPRSDSDFIRWFDHFVANIGPELGVNAADMTALTSANADFHAKASNADNTNALFRHAIADKSDSRTRAENLIRAEARRIKARSDYTEGLGLQLGIEGAQSVNDLSSSSPDLNGTDLTGGVVSLSFAKYKSAGVNIYCQRETDTDWVLIARATVSPYIDNRPLLNTGKPEMRRSRAA